MKNNNIGAKSPLTNNFEFENIRSALDLIRRKSYAVLISADEYGLELDKDAKAAWNWLQEMSVQALNEMVKNNSVRKEFFNEIFSGVQSAYVDNKPVEYSEEEKDIGYISFKDMLNNCPELDRKAMVRLINIADLVINNGLSYWNALKNVYN